MDKKEYEVKKMFFCKFDCPLKKDLPYYIKNEVENYADNVEYYEFEDMDNICEKLCPLNAFNKEL